MENLINFIFRNKKFIILFFIIISILSSIELLKVKVDPDVQNMLPPKMKELKLLKKIEKTFGGMEMAIILVHSDDVLRKSIRNKVLKISKKLKTINGVESVHTLSGIEDDPFADEQTSQNELKNQIKQNPFVYGVLVSKDFKYLAIVVQLANKGKEFEITQKIKRTVLKIKGNEKIYFGGMPFIRNSISKDVPKDMTFFMPIGILIMMLFLFLSFKDFSAIFLPFSVVIMSILFSMALVPLFGWKMTTITIILPVILIAVANDYGIHFISHYQQISKKNPNLTQYELVKQTLKTLSIPVIAAGLTTIAGMLCLLSHIIVPASQMGILAGLGIFFALIASLFFIPSVMFLMPKSNLDLNQKREKKSFTDLIILKTAIFVTTYPKQILISFSLFSLFIFGGIKFLVVDSNLINYYPKNSQIVKISNIINKKFGGAQTVDLLISGDVRNPELLKKTDKLSLEISKLKYVGNISSLSKLIKLMTKGFNKKGTEGYNQIPNSYKGIEWYLEQFKEKGDEETLKRFVDKNFNQSLMIVQITTASSDEIKNVVKKIKKLVKHSGLNIKITGSAVIFSKLIDKVVSGQILSLFLSIFVVGFIVVFLFRSITVGFIALLPLFLSIMLLFGAMGYLGVNLDIATAMLSSIMIGVGIDYTIHFLWHYRKEKFSGENSTMAVKKTLQKVGRGIIFNAFSVIVGFFVLIFSSFMPIKFFGALIMLSIFTCLIGALIFLPAFCIVFNPVKLSKTQKKQ